MTDILDLGLMERMERNVAQLLAQNDELRKANVLLASENERVGDLVGVQRGRIGELSAQVDELLLRKSVTEVSGGVKAAKLRINRLLKDVDRCIALMNK